MGEEQIKVTIDKEGAFHVKTHGLKGEDCLKALDELLADLVDAIDDPELTREYKETPAGQSSKTFGKIKSKKELGSGQR